MASPAVCVSPLSPCLLTSCHPSRPSHSRSVKASSPFMNRSLSRGRGHICGGDDLQDERREKFRRGRRDAADALKVSEICRLMVSVDSLGPDSPVSQIFSDLSAGSVLVLNCWSSPWKL